MKLLYVRSICCSNNGALYCIYTTEHNWIYCVNEHPSLAGHSSFVPWNSMIVSSEIIIKYDLCVFNTFQFITSCPFPAFYPPNCHRNHQTTSCNSPHVQALPMYSPHHVRCRTMDTHPQYSCPSSHNAPSS